MSVCRSVLIVTLKRDSTKQKRLINSCVLVLARFPVLVSTGNFLGVGGRTKLVVTAQVLQAEVVGRVYTIALGWPIFKDI